MQNVIGPPVREQDFVGRSQELAHAWSLLRDNHLLLSEPRRVGKTSLMHRLQQEAPSQGHAGAAYCSAAGLNDEAEFVARLCATVVCTPGFESVASAIADHRVAGLLGRIKKLGLGPVVVELAELERSKHGTLSEALRLALGGLPPGRPYLILIDELPVLLAALIEADRPRARRFLEWFRSVRQGPSTHANPVRWVLAGSIGLAPLTSREGWSSLINDLHTLPLGAMREEEARSLFDGLALAHHVPLSAADRDALLARLGWPVPYFLQLAFARLRGPNRVPPGPALPDAVVAALCGVESAKDFQHWWGRLDKELGPVGAQAAEVVLDACAADPAGAAASLLREKVAGFWGEGERERERSAMMEQLAHDGYLVFEPPRWRFRSPLLREVWLARRER